MGVHQQCYGVPIIPQNDWICDLCRTFAEKGKYLRCPFCDKRGGAMKPTCTRVDTNLFEASNPNFHDFLASYADSEEVKSLPKFKPISLYAPMKVEEEEESSSFNSNNCLINLLGEHEEEGHKHEEDLYYDFEIMNDNFTGIPY